MAIKTINYTVSADGITPSSQQFGGVQGDHRVTALKFTIDQKLYNAIIGNASDTATIKYRFDAYDGSGGMVSSEPKDLKDDCKTDGCIFYLEEWQTRYGGRIQVYLVITKVINTDEKLTKMELYSFPAVLSLQERPDGHHIDKSDFESVSALYEGAKGFAERAENTFNQLMNTGGVYFGTIEPTDERIKAWINPGTSVMKIKDEDGNWSSIPTIKGEPGKDGKDAVTDTSYDPESENAQSGTAVAQAISPVDKRTIGTRTLTGKRISISDAVSYEQELTLKVIPKNLWSCLEDSYTFESNKNIEIELPAGIYTFSATVTSTDTDSNVCLLYDVTNKIALGRLQRGERNSITFELKNDTHELGLYASNYATASEGDTATWSDIQLEKGTIATNYDRKDLTDVCLKLCGQNIFNKNEAEIVDGYLHTNKSFASHSGSRTVVIPCKPNTDYVVSKIKSARFTIAYSSEKPSNGSALGEVVSNPGKPCLNIKTDATAKYLLIWYWHNTADTLSAETIFSSIYVEESRLTLADYNNAESDGIVEGLKISKPSFNIISNSLDVDIECKYIVDRLKAVVYKPKTTKKVVFMGDSIFGNHYSSSGVVKQFEEITGYECYNLAFGGTRAVSRSISSTYAPNSFDAGTIASAIVDNDFTEQESTLETAVDPPVYYKDRLKTLKYFCWGNGFADTDILVINWGTNDWNGSNTLDDYYTALENFIVTMQTKFPNLIVVKVTPTQRFIKNDKTGLYESGSVIFNDNNNNLYDFAKKDKELSDNLNIKVIDAYNIGINDYNKDTFFNDTNNGDYTHHGVKGRRLLAEVLAREIV